MSRMNRYVFWSVQAVLLASGAGWTAAARADAVINLLQSEATTLLDENQVTLGTDGTAAGAAAGPCLSGVCLPTPVGPVQLSFTSGNRNGQTAGSASTSIGGIASAQATASLPTVTTAVSGGFALTDNTVTATELGTTGSLGAAAAGSWDTLTFTGATPGETGTISLTVTLATPTSEFTDVGTGGGCISVGGICDPFTNQITGAGATETLTASVSLNQPELVFSALYAVADSDFNIETTTIDPDLVLTLPKGVSFMSVSGNSGGMSSSPPPAPEPGSLALFGCVGLMLAVVRRRRSSRPS